MNVDALKFVGVVALVVVAIAVVIANIGNEQNKVERALNAQGLTNVSVNSNMFVPCLGGGKGRYGYKWTASRNGQRVEGEACSGGLFQKTVIKP